MTYEEKEKVIYVFKCEDGKKIYCITKIADRMFATLSERGDQTDEIWSKICKNLIEAAGNSLAYYEKYGIEPHDDPKLISEHRAAAANNYPVVDEIVSIEEFDKIINH